MFESLKIQESTQATGNQKMQQLRSWLPFRLWNVLEVLPTLDGCTTFTSDVTPGRRILIP
jgi:hypothetical protein